MEVIVILKVLFSLLVVLGMIFVFSYMLKNYFPKVGYGGKEEDIKIRDIKFISRDKGIATFEFDSKIFLIAFDSTKIFLLDKKNKQREEDGQAV